MPRFIVIDGNSLLFRCYYATSQGGRIPSMTTSAGIPTNAIHAFGSMLLKILSGLKEGDGIFVGFDADGQTFRKAEFSSYKANRKPCPPDLVKQFPASREMLDALGILHYEEHGIEADDICGSLAKKAAKEGYKVSIYTSDRDYLQLIEENIEIEIPQSGLSETKKVNLGNIQELYGFSPLQTIDYKGLAGDTSDNLPGIPGIGEKKALDLLRKYGTFEEVVNHADEIGGKTGQSIKENAELGRECYHLATIITDADLPFAPKSCLYKGYSRAAAEKFAAKYELRAFLSRLPEALAIKDLNGGFSYETVKELPQIPSGKDVSLVLDIASPHYHDETPDGVGVSYDGHAYYILWNDFVSSKAVDVLSDKTIKAYDAKAISYVFRKYGLPIGKIKDDLLIATYLLDSSVSSSPEAIYGRYGEGIYDMEAIEKAAYMAYRLEVLLDRAHRELESTGSLKLYEEVEMPLTLLLSEMESEGFPLVKKDLEELAADTKAKMEAAEEKLAKYLGDVNPNSPKQLSEALFGPSGLLPGRAKGTGAEVLEPLRNEHPAIAALLEYRKYSKVYSTYALGLLPFVGEDGLVRTYFNQAQTATGRLSSSSPNLQNISGREEEGEKLRKAFRYEDGRYLLSLDYSQIELRVLAYLSHCQSYIDVFKEGHDVHAETARRLFPGQEITHDLRKKAKAANFAIVYGTTVYGLSEQINSSYKEASDLIESFYGAYPELKDYLTGIAKDATGKGYVTTLFGRRRYLNDINSPNYARREAARRAAMNAPVQGSAADILKIALLKSQRALKDNDSTAKMVLTVHDEIVFSGSKEELERMEPILKKAMEGATELDVPLVAEGKIAKDYYSCKE